MIETSRFLTVVSNPMCLVVLKRQLTEARTRELQGMLTPQEGDVCGSRWPQ